MILVTHFVAPPEYPGWLEAWRCSLCGETVFVHNLYACKPLKGDYYLMEDLACPNRILAHNLEFIARGVGAVRIYHAQS